MVEQSHSPPEEAFELSRRTLTKLLAAGGASALGVGGATSSSLAANRGRGKGNGAGGGQGPGCRDARVGIELPRQGPDVLYEDPVDAPQFENTGEWTADPLLVSGTDAYAEGEYIYQDHIYDDHGANITDTAFFQANRPEPDYSYYSPPTGDILYPETDSPYFHNAADLLEFRARPVGGGIAYRITLNTMVEPDVTGIAIGINTDGETGDGMDWGYGLGELGELGLDHVLVTWGTGAELDGSTEDVRSVDVDTARNQIEVIVDLDPGEETWRHYAVTGLFDTDETAFVSVDQAPTENAPGYPQANAFGESFADASPPPVFNVAFRFDESLGAEEFEIIPEPPGDTTRKDILGYKPGPVGSGHWREHDQANALAERDISEFYADIDFEMLAAEESVSNVPETGYFTRLYASRQDFGEGVVDDNPDEETDDERNRFLNRIQPYSIYIPESYDPETDHPLHVFLHGSTSSFNEVGVGQRTQLTQLGEQRDAIMLFPEGRGPSLSYIGLSELDVFEAWSDAISRYSHDPTRVTLSGYSMGGFGTFRLASLYPGLFAKGFPIVAFADSTERLENLRNVPILMWNSTVDNLVPIEAVRPTQARLQELGYRHQLCEFPEIFEDIDGHFYFGERDEWGPAQAFLDGEYLGPEQLDRTPQRVTFRRDPSEDEPELGLVHDRAYWVSDVAVTDGAEDGRVDVRSEAFGEALPEPENYEREADEPDSHQEFGTRWTGTDETATPQNTLDITLERVGEVTLWVEGANININAPVELQVDSTAEATITLTGSFGETTVTVPAGETERTVRLPVEGNEGGQSRSRQGGRRNECSGRPAEADD